MLNPGEKEFESEGLLEREVTRPSNPRRTWTILRGGLAISVLLNIVLAAFAVLAGRGYRSSYDHGFETDLGAAKGEIELVQHVFGGGVELDEDGNFLTDTMGSEYIGPPSPTVDLAWDYIERGMNIDLHGQEAAKTKTFQWPETGAFLSGLEVFHSLHCLNKLRQALYPKAYGHVFAESSGPLRKNHIGHCLNHLRQSIQCHSDLTPMEWERVGNKLILSMRTPHTCRNFDKIHQWALGRMTDFDSLALVANGTLSLVS